MDSAQPRCPVAVRTPWAGRAALILATALCVLGIKLWLIGRYGSAVPFWDQWDAEADFLYRPYLRGELRLADLFAFHNEHRIFWTRALSLAELRAYGSWQPLFQMSINAVLHAGAIGLLVAMVGSALTRGRFLVLCAISLAVFAIPFGWENTLNAFHANWYFLILLGLIALWLVIGHSAFSYRWSIGTLIAAADYLTSASGALTPLVMSMVCTAQASVGRRKGRSEWIGIIALLALSLLAIADVLRNARRGMETQDLGQFYAALVAAAAYPFTDGGVGAVLLLYAPVIALAVWTLRAAPPLSDGRWMILGVTLWAACQTATIAYGRPPETILSPRYLDIYLIVTVSALASALALLDGKRRSVTIVAALWMVVVLAALGMHWTDAFSGIEQKGDQGRKHLESVRSYLRSGNIADLMPPHQIPYPVPSRLAAVISVPEIRKILPRALQPEAAGGVAGRP